MRWIEAFAGRLAVAGLVGLAACSSEPGVDPNGTNHFDARKVASGVAAVNRVNDAPAMASFRLVGQHLNDLTGAPAASVAMLSSSDRLAQAVARIAATVMPLARAQNVPILRSALLGKTFVYDLAQKRYVIDPARTGAPANGVRFVLYEVNPDTKAPKEPLTETGVSDLTDEQAGAPNSVGLRLRVSSGTATFLDYSFGITGSIGAATFTVTGFMSDGTDRVNFDITANSQLFGTDRPVVLDATIAVPSQQFTVTVKLNIRPAAAMVDLTAVGGSDQVSVHASLTPSTIDATIKVNGQLFATATGDPKNPTIKGENGRELTADELAAVGAIAGFADGVLKLVTGLLEPVGYLLLLGLGLGA